MTSSHSIRLYNWELLTPNIKEYHILKREIFSEHRYHFETDNPRPFIIDIGSYIGLSTLYFKRLFPHSTILAFEPHPEAFQLLTHNLDFNRIPRSITGKPSGLVPVRLTQTLCR
jgi:hypothetical protein